MKRLAFTPLAMADIDRIWDCSAENWWPDQADRYTDEIRDACLALASGRKTGRAADVRDGYWKYITGSHVIYFIDRADQLDVSRILHGSQDADRHLYTSN